MDTKLTDFSNAELTFLYLTLEDKLKDINNKIEIVEGFDESLTRYELYAGFVEQHNMCSQLMTKVNEASLVVKAEEIIKYS